MAKGNQYFVLCVYIIRLHMYKLIVTISYYIDTYIGIRTSHRRLKKKSFDFKLELNTKHTVKMLKFVHNDILLSKYVFITQTVMQLFHFGK